MFSDLPMFLQAVPTPKDIHDWGPWTVLVTVLVAAVAAMWRLVVSMRDDLKVRDAGFISFLQNQLKDNREASERMGADFRGSLESALDKQAEVLQANTAMLGQAVHQLAILTGEIRDLVHDRRKS